MNRKILYKYIHKNFIELLAKYVEHPLYTEENIHNYIVPPILGASVGVKGAMLLKFLWYSAWFNIKIKMIIN